MTFTVQAPDVSSAWLIASTHLLEHGGDASNLAVCVADPSVEQGPIRTLIDKFVTEQHARAKPPLPVATVADTIFPSPFYRPEAKNAEAHLYEMEELTRSTVRRHPLNRRGTYFERLVAYPVRGGAMNQLSSVVSKLRSVRHRGQENGNLFELAVFDPELDTYPMGFPCLSHISLTLRHGVLDTAAIYRNQYFLEREYGNLLGLGALISFIARESGFGRGELLCVASHAKLEIDKYGRAGVEALLNAASRVMAKEPD